MPIGFRRYSAVILSFCRVRWVLLFALSTSLALLVLAIFLYAQMLPAISGLTYRRDTETASASLPLFLPSDGRPTLTVHFSMHVPIIAPHRYMLQADDCVSAFRVDGTALPLTFVDPCTPALAKEVRLPVPLLVPGRHTVDMTITDTGGMEGIDLRAAPTDALVVAMQLLIAFLAALAFFFVWRLLGLRWWWMLSLLLVGIVLRILYFDVTPYAVRVNDWDGHTAYVQWLLDHHSIPKPNDGWEFFQPPLYYLLSVVFAAVANHLFGTREAMLWALQFEGLLLSVGVLLVGAWVGNILFPYETEKRKNLTFIALIAVFPTLVMSASRINNDGLTLLLSFLGIGFLLRFWSTGRLLSWYAFIACITLGLLTKFSVIALLPPAYLCLFFSKHLSLKKKCTVGALSLLVILACTEWFYAYTYLSADTFPIGNMKRLQDSLIVTNEFHNFIGFNTDRFVRVPYLLPYDDATGRKFFWEYLIKSSLFGEFDFGGKLFALLQGLLAVTLVVVPLGLYGFVRDLFSPLRRSHALPLVGVFFFTLAAQIAMRLLSPFSCSQDFRYSMPILIPFFAWQVTAFSGYRKPFRIVACIALGLFIGLSALFMALIPVYRP